MQGQKSLHPAGSARFANEKIVDVSHGRYSVNSSKKSAGDLRSHKVSNELDNDYNASEGVVHRTVQEAQRNIIVNGVRTKVRFESSSARADNRDTDDFSDQGTQDNIIVNGDNSGTQAEFGDYVQNHASNVQDRKSGQLVGADGQPFNFNTVLSRHNSRNLERVNRPMLNAQEDQNRQYYKSRYVVTADNAPYSNTVPRQVVPQIDPRPTTQDRNNWKSTNTVYADAQPFNGGVTPHQVIVHIDGGLDQEGINYLRGRTVVQGVTGNTGTSGGGGNGGPYAYGDNQNPDLDRKARDQMLSRLEQLRQYQRSRPGQHLLAHQPQNDNPGTCGITNTRPQNTVVPNAKVQTDDSVNFQQVNPGCNGGCGRNPTASSCLTKRFIVKNK